MPKQADKENVLRQCIVTREQQPKTRMIRFVVDPENQLIPDLKMKLPGRGVWVLAGRLTLEKALDGKFFQKSLKKNVKWQENLPQHLAELMLQQVLSRLSFVNKAGKLVKGFDRVTAGLEDKNLAFLFHAEDAGRDGCEKLNRKFAGIQSTQIELLENRLPIGSQALSGAIGGSNVKHIGLMESGATESFVEALHKYIHYLEG